MASTAAKWVEVSASNPCPICHKPNWCSIREDGVFAVCRREASCPHYGSGKHDVDKSGSNYWSYRLIDDRPSTESWDPPRCSHTDAGGMKAQPEILDKVYQAFLRELPLKGSHLLDLEQRGFPDPHQVRELGYRSLGKERARACWELTRAGLEGHLPHVPGFVVSERDGRRYWSTVGKGGILFPARDPDGRIVGLMLRREKDDKGPKYTWLSSKKKGGVGPSAPVHCPLFTGDTTTVRVTEGALKADVATVLSGMLTIGLPGVSFWRRAAKVVKHFAASRVRIAFDADCRTNHTVASSLRDLYVDLRGKGLQVDVETWEATDGKGIDDLLAAGKTPKVLSGEQASEWIAGLSMNVKPIAKSGYQTILNHFHERYHPVYREGTAIHAGSLGRLVKQSEALSGAPIKLIDLLAEASDAPTDKHGNVDRDRLPRFFSDWAKSAWVDLIADLPEEEEAAEVSEIAEEGFRAKVAGALHTIVSMSYTHKRGDGEINEVQRRTLIEWANLWAKPQVWGKVRSYQLWAKRDGDALRVAVRLDLFRQLNSDIIKLTSAKFSRLAARYGVGEPGKVAGSRAVELAAEFVADLLEQPRDQNGHLDTLTEDLAPAHMREKKRQSVQIGESGDVPTT